MLNYIGLGLVAAVVTAAVPVTDPVRLFDKDLAQGTWTLVKGEKDGKAFDDKDLKGGKLVINGDEYTVTIAGEGTVKGKEILDESKRPKTIDITDSDGPNKGKKCEGIYEITKDEFRVCVAAPGKPRPTKFTTEKDSGTWIHVWKKEKK